MRISWLFQTFQSTLPQRERRIKMGKIDESNNISIHAPAKGATGEKMSDYKIFKISIHAPAKGATRERPKMLNPFTISIHAPAKGATYIRE